MFVDKCAQTFMLLTVPQKLGDKEETPADFEGKTATMKILLETKFWSNITNYMEENQKTALAEQLKWRGLLDESIEPLLQDLSAWSKDSANVS
jgi:hypothetical protein